MTASSHPCCLEHEGPHVHGCQISRVAGRPHRGACLTDSAAAARHELAEEARHSTIPSRPRDAWIRVALDDDRPRKYPRPSILEISRATTELERLDNVGALPAEGAAAIRTLLAAVGRLSADGLADAFPPRCSNGEPHPSHDYLAPRGRLHCYGIKDAQ